MKAVDIQILFLNLLKDKGIEPQNTLLYFYSPTSKRLTSTGNIYATMLFSNDITTYTIDGNISINTTKIIDSNIDYFYYLSTSKINNNDKNKFYLTIFDSTTKTKINLLGGIQEWWKKINLEYEYSKKDK